MPLGKLGFLPPINLSTSYAPKDHPTVETSRRETATAKQARGRRAVGVGGTREQRNIVANRDPVTSQRQPYLIYEDGVNYTPRPLADPALPAATELAFAGSPSMATSSSALSTASGSRFTLSRRQSRASTAFSMVSGEVWSLSELTRAPKGDAGSVRTSTGSRAPSAFRLRGDSSPARPATRTTFTVTLTLSETFYMLQPPSRAAPGDSDEGARIAAENAEYERALAAGRAASHAATQTDPVAQRHKQVYAPRLTRKNAVAWATAPDIYDTYQGVAMGSAVSGEGGGEGQTDAVVATDAEEDDYLVEFEYLGQEFGNSFLNALMVMERLVVKGDFIESQLLFRRSLEQDPLSTDVEFTYSINNLWTYAYPETAHRCVTSLSWSRVDGNVLAVGYGKFGYNARKVDGLVCVWNVKNPAHPERLYRFDEPVTSVAFGETRASVLAVAFYSGLVLLIDIVARKPVVKASNSAYPLYHPVWQAKWFPVDAESRGQFLVTCGGNGRVYRYSEAKFFASEKLLTVHRPEGDVPGVELQRERRARHAPSAPTSALVLAPHPADARRYLVGTSGGHVYACSARSRRGDYAHVFVAHEGPVYDLQFNPHCAQVFLTSGADGRVRVWAESLFEPLASLEGGGRASAPVQCALWDPARSTVIVAGAGDRLEVWDLRRSASAPKGGAPVPGGGRVSALAFAPLAPSGALCVGDDAGRVHVAALAGMPFAPAHGFQEGALLDAIGRLLVTRPRTLARLRKLGPPFARVAAQDAL